MFGLQRRAEGGSLLPREDPFMLMREDLDQLFERFLRRWLPMEEPLLRNLEWESEETEKEVILRAELPGFDVKEIEVRLVGNELVVKAEHREEKKGKDKEPAVRRYGRVHRTITLPAGTDPAGLEADFRNGMLTIHLPRLPEAVGKRIEVKA